MVRYKRQTWLANSLKWQQLRPVLEDFSAAGIKCCLLKGAAMVLFYYQDISQRPEYSDLDLFISEDNLQHAMLILQKHQFIVQKTFLWNTQALQHSLATNGTVLSSLHAIHFRKEKLIIDLHWKLHPFIANLGFGTIEQEMSVSTLMGNNLYYFNLEMQLIHIAVHDAFQDKHFRSINSTIDFCFLLNKTPVNVQKLAELSTRLGVRGFIHQAMLNNEAFIAPALFAEYQRVFHPLLTFEDRYLVPLLYRQASLPRRATQLFYFLKKANFNPIKTLRNLRFYFGVANYMQLMSVVFRRYFLSGR